MEIHPKSYSVSIIVRGSFNPSIFQPWWLVHQGLVTGEEAEVIDSPVISQKLAKFTFPDGFAVKVEPHYYQISTQVTPFVRISDLTQKIFGQILAETPITAFGINLEVEFPLTSDENRNRLGKLLAPQAVWGKWGESLDSEDLATRGGMIHIAMKEVVRSNRENGYFRVEVRPGSDETIIVLTNDHFDFGTPWTNVEKGDSAAKMLIMRKEFDDSLKKSESLVDHIMHLAQHGEETLRERT